MRNFTKVGLLMIFMLSSVMTFSQCDWKVVLYDQYGDGWNGGHMDVIVDGTVVLDDITLPYGGGPLEFTFSVADGADVYTTYSPGSWAYENTYYIYDASDVEVAVDGAGYVQPSGIPSGTITGYCPMPELTINPTILDLGEWPVDGWQEAGYLELYNSGTGNVVIDASELDDQDGVFSITDLALPLTLAQGGAPVSVGVSFNGSTAGAFTATYVASWGAKSVTTAALSATAYDPTTGDIVEDPFMVSLPVAEVGVSTAMPMRGNYILPGTATNGKDVVYKFDLADDQEVVIGITNATETAKVAIYGSDFGGEGGPMIANAVASGGTDITAPLYMGSYYVVVSCEADDAGMTFDINIDGTTLPVPDKAFNPSPADGELNVTNPVTLSWEFAPNTYEYKLSYGTTYPASDILVDWTTDLATSFDLGGLDPSMQYFWRVDVRNNNGTTDGDNWGFTTTITPPSGLTATVDEVDPMVQWNVNLAWTGSDKALLGYNVYRDAVMVNAALVTGTTYVDEDLAYNMNPCYEYTVEAVFDEGVSAMSNVASACITGVATVNGSVTALLSGLPISGAEVKLTPDGAGEVGTFTTDAMGNYSGTVYEGTYDYHVVAEGYIDGTRDDVDVAFGATVTEDFQLDEFPFPPNSVVAVATEDDQAVDVYWNAPGSSGGGGIVDEHFEGGMPSWFVGDDPQADWHVADNMLTLTTGGANVWRSGYKDEAYGDIIYQVSHQRNGGSEGGSMGIYVRATGLFTAATTNANAFCWTTNGYYWIADVEAGALVNWAGWMTTGAISQGLGVANTISAEISGMNITYFINGTMIESVTANETEGFVGGFGHEGTVASEMAFDYWQIIPAGKSANMAENTEIQYEGKGSIEECLSTNTYDKGYVEVQGLNYNILPLAGEKELSGYNVYRQLCDESTPMLFMGMTLDTNFRDNTWGTTDWGMYKWAVEAVYDNNNSEAIYSNCLDKDMITTVSVDVSTNSGDAPEGCYVLFTNVSEPDLELFYETDLDATGLYTWEGFRKGVYDIDVILSGFTPIDLDGVAIDDAETFVWVLEELLAPPANLYVTPTGFATWTGSGSIPFEVFMENFDTQEQFDLWEVIHNGSSAETWKWVTTSNNGNTLDGTPFAYVDSDLGGPGVSMDETLISPVVDASMVDELILEFDLVHQQIGDHMDVDIFDGDDWVTVWTSDGDSGPYPWGPTVHKDFDISEYANADLRVRFHYIAGWDWFIGLDNVVIHDNSGKYAGNKEFQFYKVFHNDVFSTDRDTNFYQYGENEEVLVPGETYHACVSSLYSTGLSAETCYDWTFLPCDSFAGPSLIMADNVENSDDVLVVWTDMIPLELIMVTQNPGDPSNGYYQSYGMGYGVAYDFSAYPDALVSAVDFRHSSWGTYGTWDYNIHVVDWDTKTLIATVGPIQSTGDDVWEEGAALGDIATGGAATVAILMEPLSNNATDAYPCLDSDSDGDPQGSVYGDLADLAGFGSSTIGNFLMNVWIYTANGGGKSTPIVINAIEGPAAQARVATNYTFNPNPIVTQQEVSEKSDKAAVSIGTNLYRDGEMLAFVANPDTFYLDSDLLPGIYDYCVATVYTEDDGEHTWASCPDVLCDDAEVTEECGPPTELTVEDLLGDGITATLNWFGAGGSFDPVWLQYDDGVNVDAIGGPAEFTYASKWDPDQLEDFDGTQITQVKLFPREAGTAFTLKVFSGDDAGTLLYEQPLSGLTFDDWNTVTLDTPVAIDITESIWVAFYVVTGGYPAGCGNYVGEPNSDLITLDGSVWEHLADYGLNYSWNMGVYVESAKGETVALPTLVDHATYSGNATVAVGNLPTSPNAVDQTTSAKEFQGYNVYRDGDQINEELVLETTYIDHLDAAGNYCYEITAVYSYCGESDPCEEVCQDIAMGVSNLDNSVNVYPNPANDFIKVEASSNIRSIEITNYMGQVVNSIKSVEFTQYTINTSDLSSGIYFIEVETTAGIEKVRVIISE